MRKKAVLERVSSYSTIDFEETTCRAASFKINWEYRPDDLSQMISSGFKKSTLSIPETITKLLVFTSVIDCDK